MVWYYKITEITDNFIRVCYNVHEKILDGEFIVNRKSRETEIINKASNDPTGRNVIYLTEKALLKVKDNDFEISKIYQIACG